MKTTIKLAVLLFFIVLCTNISGQNITISSDASWQCSWGSPPGTAAPTGWPNNATGTAWQNSVIYDFSTGNAGISHCTLPDPQPTGFNNGNNTTMWLDNSLISNRLSQGSNNNQPVFFLKTFTLQNNNITSGSIDMLVNDIGTVFLNGHLMGATTTDGEQTYTTAQIQPFLKCGVNTIAIGAANITSPCWWIFFRMSLSAPLPTISAPAITCSGQNVNLTAVSGFSTYTWSPQPTSASSNTASYSSADQPSNQIYTVTADAGTSCPITASVEANIDIPHVALTSNPTAACQPGDVVQISATMGFGTTYTWNTGYTQHNGQHSFTDVINATSIYDVTVTDGHNCTVSAALTVPLTSIPTFKKTVTAAQVLNGGLETFDFEICNSGPAMTATIVDQINPNLTVTNANGFTDIYNYGVGDIVYKQVAIPGVTPQGYIPCIHESFTVQCNFMFDQCNPNAQVKQVENCASLSTPYYSACPVPESCVRFNVIQPAATQPGLSVQADAAVPPGYTGCDEFTMRICITSNGSDPVSNILSDFIIPNGFALSGSIGYNYVGTVNGAHVFGGVAPLPAGDYGTFGPYEILNLTNLTAPNGPFPGGINKGDEICLYITLVSKGACVGNFPGFEIDFGAKDACTNETTNFSTEVPVIPKTGAGSCHPLALNFEKTHSCSGANDACILALSSGGVAPYTFHWSVSSTPWSYLNQSLVCDLGPGTYDITVTDAVGCSASIAVTIDNVTPPAITISGNTNICAGSSTTLTASAGGATGFTYHWNTGANTNPVTVTPPQQGETYSVTGTYEGCTTTASYNVAVVNAVATSDQPSKLCVDGSYPPIPYTLTATVTGQQPSTLPIHYIWASTGSTTSTTVVDPSDYYNSGTAVTVTYECYIQVGSCSEWVYDPITVAPIPVPPLTVSNYNSIAGCSPVGTVVQMWVAGGGAGVAGDQYLWSNGATTAGTSFTVQPTASTATVLVTNKWGCTNLMQQPLAPCPKSGIAFHRNSSSPNSQSACSDSPVGFTFNNMSDDGVAGDVIEWSGSLSFSPSGNNTQPATIVMPPVNPGETDTIWIRRDSGGVYVDTTFIIGTVVSSTTTITPPAPQTICSDTPVVFNFDSIGFPGCSGDSVEWSLNSNFTSSQIGLAPINITLSVDTNTTDTLWFRRRNGATGVLTSATFTILTVTSPYTAPVAPAPQTVCSPYGNTFTFGPVSASACGGNVIEWATSSDFSGSQQSTSPAIITVPVSAGSSVTIWIRSRDNSTGLVSAATYTTATVNSDPDVPIAPAPQSTCADTPVTFAFGPIYGAGCGGSYFEYSTTGDFSSYVIDSTGDSITVAVYPGTTQTVWIRSFNPVTGATSLATSTTASVTTSPESITAPAPQTVCSDTPYIFTFSPVVAGGCGASQIEWSANSNFSPSTIISSPGSISISVDTSTTDTIWMRSRSLTTGEVSGATFTTITVNTQVLPPTAPAPQTACSNQPVSFTFNVTAAGCSGDMVQWSTTGVFDPFNTLASPAAITIVADTGTTDTIWFRSVNSISGIFSSAVFSTISNNAEAGFTASTVAQGSNCQDGTPGSIQLLVSGGIAPYSFAWSDGETSQDIESAPFGAYAVSITDMYGCINIANVFVNCTGCDSLLAYYSTSRDTVCVGDSVHLFLGGGPWGRVIRNGQIASSFFRIPANGETKTVIASPATLGVNYECLVVYSSNPDSTSDYCSDTACINIYVRDCHCNVHAQVSLTSDTICVGGSDTIKIAGGVWGQLIVDGKIVQDNPDDTNWIFNVANYIAGGGLVLNSVPDSMAGTTHTFCYVAFSDNPDSTSAYCSDTSCITAFVQNCQKSCAAYNGQAVLQMTHLAGTTFQFKDIGAIEPNFINWIIDGTQQQQTTARGTFDYSFDVAGEHTICMQAAYIYTDNLGNNICCYKEACDSLDVDSCDFWKATAQITYQLSPQNYHNVNFYYSGNTDNLTIVWDFGDGTTGVSNGEDITHYYADSTWNFCAEIIWSLGDTAVFQPDSGGVCCCVDTICSAIVVAPCNATSFDIGVDYDLADGTPTYVLTRQPTTVTLPEAPALNNIVFENISWSVNGNIVQTGISRFFGPTNPIGKGSVLCVTANYVIRFVDGEIDTCSTTVCDTVGNILEMDQYGLLRYFPNPTNDLLTLEIGATMQDKSATVELMNGLGQPVMTKQLISLTPGVQQNYIDLRSVVPGMYIMRVTIGDHTTSVKVIRN